MPEKPQNVTGMRDHLPGAMLLRQHIISTLTHVFERHGFEPLSTSVVEYDETLSGKIGDEEKLIYRLDDTGGKRRLALRYDQTVPLARVVAQYANQIQFPWRRYAIGQSFRGERLKLVRVAPNKYWIGHKRIAVGKGNAALVTNRDDRANEMLIHAHPSGHAIHYDADPSCCHKSFLLLHMGEPLRLAAGRIVVEPTKARGSAQRQPD